MGKPLKKKPLMGSNNIRKKSVFFSFISRQKIMRRLIANELKMNILNFGINESGYFT